VDDAAGGGYEDAFVAEGAEGARPGEAGGEPELTVIGGGSHGMGGERGVGGLQGGGGWHSLER